MPRLTDDEARAVCSHPQAVCPDCGETFTAAGPEFTLAFLQAGPAAVRPATEGLTDAIAEGLHKAMCFGPATLHNRLACERPQVYLALAESVVAHPALRAAVRPVEREDERSFSCVGHLTASAAPPVDEEAG